VIWNGCPERLGEDHNIRHNVGSLKHLHPKQYSETNMMHFLFNLLRIKGLYMFRALLAHPQEALHKHVCYVSWLHHPVAANWHNTHAIYQVPLVKRLLSFCIRALQQNTRTSYLSMLNLLMVLNRAVVCRTLFTANDFCCMVQELRQLVTEQSVCT
jgi:hypothetical protein